MGRKLLFAVFLLINAEILWGMRRGDNFNLGMRPPLSADQQKDFNERMRQLQNNIPPVNDNDNAQDNLNNRQKRKLEEELERNRREQEAILKKIKLRESRPPQWSDYSSSEDSSSDDN